MTRPVIRNRRSLTIAEAEGRVRAVEASMILLPDSEAVYREWRKIVVQHGVLGVQVHDARLAAAMFVHRVSHILTLNVTDFERFSGPIALHPTHHLAERCGLFLASDKNRESSENFKTGVLAQPIPISRSVNQQFSAAGRVRPSSSAPARVHCRVGDLAGFLASRRFRIFLLN
jgi:hypothetical protein